MFQIDLETITKGFGNPFRRAKEAEANGGLITTSSCGVLGCSILIDLQRGRNPDKESCII